MKIERKDRRESCFSDISVDEYFVLTEDNYSFYYRRIPSITKRRTGLIVNAINLESGKLSWIHPDDVVERVNMYRSVDSGLEFLDDIRDGECFCWSGEVYVRVKGLEGNEVRCIALKDGKTKRLINMEGITKVKKKEFKVVEE